MAREFIKLKELTITNYLNYKRTEMDDRQIARLYDVSHETLGDWKRANGLNGVSIRQWSTWEKYFPKDVEKLKQRYIEYWNKGWKHEYIAEEMGMSRSSLSRFIERFLPTYKAYTVKLVLTDEQKRIIKENGLKIDTVRHRIHAGWPIEKAINEPAEIHFGTVMANVNKGWCDLSDKHKQMAMENGIHQSTVIKRLRRGWSMGMAVTKPPRKMKRGTKK